MALRGPLGSMARAVEGVIEEQVVIIRKRSFLIILLNMFYSVNFNDLGSFLISILGFAVVLMSYTYMTMQPSAATASSIVIVIGSYFWYSYCVRIYNNFKWTDSSVSFTESHHKYAKKIEDQRVLLDMHMSFKECYFSRKDISAKQISSNPWTRNYFVMQGRYLMYFESKGQFHDQSVGFVDFPPYSRILGRIIVIAIVL
jgi:hypothetical protein